MAKKDAELLTKDILELEYIKKEKTLIQIAKEYSVTEDTVRKRMIKFSIQIRQRQPKVMIDVVCKTCNKQFKKSESECKKSQNNFCNHSCAAIYNNKYCIKNRIQLQGMCKICQCKIRSALKYCDACRETVKIQRSIDSIEKLNILKEKKKNVIKRTGICNKCNVEINKRNLYCNNCRDELAKENNELQLKDLIYQTHHKSTAFAKIRSRARTVCKSHYQQKCALCEYNKHIEAAHIKAVSEFSLETKISEVNHYENIVPLCPNCHWEFDNGLIKVQQIKNGQTKVKINPRQI